MRSEFLERADRGAVALDRFAAAHNGASHQDATPRIRACEIAEFMAMDFPPREHILAPWLPTQGLALIHAKRGVGKTHVGLGIAYAVASGGAFLKWHAPKARGVLYLDGEMPAATIQARLGALIQSADREPTAPLRIVTPDLQTHGMLNLASLADQRELEPSLAGIDLIVVDNLSCLCRGGNENEAESWQPVQDWALAQRARGRSVLMLHHDGKGGHQRGTSKREDVLDSVLQLVPPSDYSPDSGACFEVHYRKARGFYGDDARAFEAKLGTDQAGRTAWVTKSVEESTRERVHALKAEGLTQGEIAEELGVNKSTVSRHLRGAR